MKQELRNWIELSDCFSIISYGNKVEDIPLIWMYVHVCLPAPWVLSEPTGLIVKMDYLLVN